MSAFHVFDLEKLLKFCLRPELIFQTYWQRLPSWFFTYIVHHRLSFMCPSSFFAVIIEKNYSLKCYSAVLIKQKWSDFINKLNLKVISAVYFFLYNFLLLYVINILPYSHVWHTLEKLLSGVFWAPQRLKPEKPFLNAVLKAFEHSSTGCEAPWASSRQVNLPRNKFKEKKKKNQCKRVNVNVCSRESDPWRCVKTRVRTKLMTSSSAQPTLWREMARQASF